MTCVNVLGASVFIPFESVSTFYLAPFKSYLQKPFKLATGPLDAEDWNKLTAKFLFNIDSRISHGMVLNVLRARWAGGFSLHMEME